MRPARQSIFKSPADRRRFTLALAMAEERLAEAHAEAAVDFLRSTEGMLSYERGLDIFYRMVGVPDRVRTAVAVNALAELARAREERPPPAATFINGHGHWGRLLKRLRGRRADALRNRVERAARRARARVESAYLEGAAIAIRELEGAAPPAEAVQLFIDALDIAPGWAERVFHKAVTNPDERAA